jgi:hypothetical protein
MNDLWRFQYDLTPHLPTTVPIRWQNPVEIRSAGKRVGFACVSFEFGVGYLAECATRYDIPERLDTDAGNSVHALPHVLTKYSHARVLDPPKDLAWEDRAIIEYLDLTTDNIPGIDGVTHFVLD